MATNSGGGRRPSSRPTATVQMETETEENPWKNKGRVKVIAMCDVIVALLGLTYVTYRMFLFWYYLHATSDQPTGSNFKGNLAFFIFIWMVFVVSYVWQALAALVLFASINVEATETDPYVCVQKCHCWLRTARVILIFVALKLTAIPFIILSKKWMTAIEIDEIGLLIGLGLGLVELIFRSCAMVGIKSFMQDLHM